MFVIVNIIFSTPVSISTTGKQPVFLTDLWKLIERGKPSSHGRYDLEHENSAFWTTLDNHLYCYQKKFMKILALRKILQEK